MTGQWFESSVRGDVVERRLHDLVPELSDRTIDLRRCRVTRIRATGSHGEWTATYELDLHDEATGHDWTFATAGLLTPPEQPLPAATDGGPFGSESWSLSLPDLRLRLQAMPTGSDLPGLAAIMDPERARELLETVLATDDPGQGGALLAVKPVLLAHKPGERATVLCRLTYEPADHARPDAVVVKVSHDGEGERAHAALTAVWDTHPPSTQLGLARPLVYMPELSMSVQEHLRHDASLKDVFTLALKAPDDSTWVALRQALEATAFGLAALHHCGSAFGPTVTFDDEFTIVRRKLTALTAVMPELDDAVADGPERIASAAERVPADELVPTHHSFRPAQVLLGEHASFIDLDKSCQAEPASDIASLTTKLLHMGVNKVAVPGSDARQHRVDQMQELRDVFVDAYSRHAVVSAERLAVWEASELLSLVLSAAKKAEHERIATCALLLRSHLDRHEL